MAKVHTQLLPRLMEKNMKLHITVLALLTMAAPLPAAIQTTPLYYQRGTNAIRLQWNGELDTALQYADDLTGPWKTAFAARPPYTTPTSKPHRFYRLGPGL